MKDEYKILIGAIIIVMIVLVGAYALSGTNSPQPAATPTPVPVTATPTATPGGGGETTPTASPTVAPTVAPTPVPSPEPESGIKLTEFGYWITYPPLGPQTWSNPKPKQEWNVVFFNRTSDRIPVADNHDARFFRQVAVERVGDLGGTVNVTINSSHSENARERVYASDYRYGVIGDNLTYLGWHSYVLTFGPGVSEQILTIPLDWEADEGTSEGFVALTIMGADGGYSVGHDREYMLNMADVPAVYFRPGSGHIWTEGGELNFEGDRFYDVDDSGEMVNVTFRIFRSEASGILPVAFDPVEYNITSSGYILFPFAFADESSMGIVRVEIDKSLVFDGYQHRLDVHIAESEDYAIGDNEKFQIFINYPA